MPCSLHPSSQGNVSLISCVKRTWKWLYWLKSTKPRILSWTVAKNMGKSIRISKAHREFSLWKSTGCSHSFWYFDVQGFYEIGHLKNDQYHSANSSSMNLFPPTPLPRIHKNLSHSQNCASRNPAGEPWVWRGNHSSFLVWTYHQLKSASSDALQFFMAGEVMYNKQNWHMQSLLQKPFYILHPPWSFSSSVLPFLRWGRPKPYPASNT